MHFLSIREFSKAPKTALSRLAEDGKAILTSNGKPAAVMLTVNADSFEKVFNLVQELEKQERQTFHTQTQYPVVSDKERKEAYERLMKFRRKKVPVGFNYKKELMGAIDGRFGSIN